MQPCIACKETGSAGFGSDTCTRCGGTGYTTGPRATDATPEALALARKCAAEDYANAYSENGEACEDILSEARESYRARTGGPDYDGPADDAAQEYACAYTDLVRASRPVCPEACDHD